MFFQNLVFFTFNLLKENRVSVLINSILTLKKERSLRSSVFREPKCFTQLYKLSFISVAIKLLNSFIFSNLWLTDMSFRSMFNGNDSILFFYIRKWNVKILRKSTKSAYRTVAFSYWIFRFIATSAKLIVEKLHRYQR